jgi:predicted transcriptional regulator
MPTITLEVSQEVADRLEAVAPESRNNYAVSALEQGMELLSPDEATQYEREVLAALEEAVEDIAAGRTHSFEQELTRWEKIKEDMLSRSK